MVGYNQNNHVITFPRPFLDTDYGFCTLVLYENNYDTGYSLEYKYPTNSTTIKRTASNITLWKTISRSWIAIGRWK